MINMNINRPNNSSSLLHNVKKIVFPVTSCYVTHEDFEFSYLPADGILGWGRWRIERAQVVS